jgi:hypothetical protein
MSNTQFCSSKDDIFPQFLGDIRRMGEIMSNLYSFNITVQPFLY